MAFDPSEPRGPGGRWIHVGAIVDRLSSMREGERVTIKGHTIRRNIPRQTHRVIIGGETRDYKDVQHAAAAVHAGSHNEHGVDVRRAQNDAVRSMAANATRKGGVTAEQVLGVRGGKLGQQRSGTGSVSGKRRGEMGKSDAESRAERDLVRGVTMNGGA